MCLSLCSGVWRLVPGTLWVLGSTLLMHTPLSYQDLSKSPRGVMVAPWKKLIWESGDVPGPSPAPCHATQS